MHACTYVDVCGKIGTKSFGGGEHFVTFLDDHTHHIRMSIYLKHKGDGNWKILRREGAC